LELSKEGILEWLSDVIVVKNRNNSRTAADMATEESAEESYRSDVMIRKNREQIESAVAEI
jgi:FixJ family two-component response regulator